MITKTTLLKQSNDFYMALAFSGRRGSLENHQNPTDIEIILCDLTLNQLHSSQMLRIRFYFYYQEVLEAYIPIRGGEG